MTALTDSEKGELLTWLGDGHPLDCDCFMRCAEPKLREMGAKVMYHGIDNHTVSPTEGQWFILGIDGGVQDGNQWRAALKYIRGERYWSSLEGR